MEVMGFEIYQFYFLATRDSRHDALTVVLYKYTGTVRPRYNELIRYIEVFVGGRSIGLV